MDQDCLSHANPLTGYSAKKGQIVDASIVSGPKQRNGRDENDQIKQGAVPKDWKAATKRQKGTDASWTKKNGYGGHLKGKGRRHKKLTKWERQGNRTHSRVEHIGPF